MYPYKILTVFKKNTSTYMHTKDTNAQKHLYIMISSFLIALFNEIFIKLSI